MTSRLHWLFVLFAVPLVLFLALRTPAFQSPDEDNHFYRAWQIAHGGLFSGGGAYVDSGILQLWNCVDKLPFKSQSHLTPANIACERAVTWSGQLIYRPFPNTAAYFPACYIPQSLAILIGRALGIGVLNTLFLARISNGIVCIAICAFALSICRRGGILIFVALLLPMTLSLFASASQDALLIALACLAFCLISRQVDRNSPFPPRDSAIVFIALFIISLARPTNAALGLVFFIPGLFFAKSARRWRLTAFTLTALIVVFTAAWWGAAIAAQRNSAHTYVPTSFHSDPKLQLAFLLHHLGVVPSLLSSMAQQTGLYIASTIGLLGWLDTPMPAPYYFAMLLILALAAIAELADTRPIPRSATGIILFSIAVNTAGVFLSSYLMFSPVGSTGLYGMQGRYFIPLIVAAACALPSVGNSPKFRERVIAIVVLAQLLTAIVLPQVIAARYY